MKRPMTNTERMLATASANVSSTRSSADSVSIGVLGSGVFFFVILSLFVRDQRSGFRDQQKLILLTPHRCFLISDPCSLITVLTHHMEDALAAGITLELVRLHHTLRHI